MAVCLVHHTRKGASGAAGDPDSARGASAIIGAVRCAFTLTTMSEEDAKAFGTPALTYNGSPQAISATVTPDDATYTVGYLQGITAIGKPTNAGNYAIVVKLPDGEQKSQTFAISKAPLTITAQDATVIQGEALPSTFGLSYSGFVNNETASVLGGTPTFTLTATGPTTYAIQPGGLTASNYQITFASGTLTVLSWTQATTNLLTQVNDAKQPNGAGLEQGLKNSLDSKLQAAIASFNQGNLTAAKNQLAAFLNEVSAQKGKGIDDGWAQTLSDSALEILNAIG